MRGPWRAALWVTAATVLMAAIDLGRRILATNDEARFASSTGLNFEPLVLVSYPDAAAPRAGSRP